MNSEILRKVYLSSVIIEVICIVMAMLIFFSIRNSRNQTRDKQQLICIITSFVIMTGTDIFNELAKGRILILPYFLNALVNAVCFCAAAAGCYYWFLYVEGRIDHTILKNEWIRRAFKAPIILLCVLNLLSVYTNWVFVILPDGEFGYGPLFFIQEGIPLFYLVIPFVHVIIEMLCRRAKNRKFEYGLYLVFILFSIISVYSGDYFLELPIAPLSILIVIEVMFFTLYQDQERKLSEYRTEVFVSQIKPHFIFNVLTAIQVLCRDKAPEAAKLLEQFAEYLRLNIDALGKLEPIPFEEELKHTRNYLAIEKTRFGDRLNIEYDIQAVQFRIPALSLQPIVENAVKYGVMKRAEGVTVRIAAKKNGTDYVVSVTDNGPGFDPAEVKDDGRAHVGIKSSAERIQAMCGGKLAVSSTIGKGTDVTITIPEEEIAKYENTSGR